MSDTTFQDKLRKKADRRQLLVLKVIASSPTDIIYAYAMKEPLYGEVSNSESTAQQTIGGIISSVVTMKMDKEPLLLAMGRNEFGVRWKLNERVITKNELKELVDELLASW